MQKKTIKSLFIFVLIVASLIGFSIWKRPTILVEKYYYYSGYFKQRGKNLTGAIEDYNKALQLNKNYQTAYISRGSAYMDLKKYKQAILDYSTAISINPVNPEPYAYRGRGYYEINDVAKSILDFNKAIQLDEKFGYAYLNRALVRYTKLQDYAGGCTDLKIASDLGESEADDYFKEGICD